MAKGFKLQLNSSGVVDLLNDPGVAAYLRTRAEGIAASLEGDWQVSSFTTDRANATVRTADKTARTFASENPAAVVSSLGG